MFFLFLFITLVGCATTPIRSSDAVKAPKERLLAFQEKTQKTESVIVITRDEGILGSGCYYAININNLLAARLDVGETAKFYVEPGEILFKVGRDPFGRALCGLGQDEWTQRETVIRQGEIKYFRLLLDANGKSDIQRSE